jgi:hypothetical protein
MSGIVAHLLELLLRFLADDGLVQQHMIQHRAQRVVGVGAAGSFFNGFRDGDAQAALVFRIGRQDAAPGLGQLVGLANTSAPQVCIIERRNGFCWYDTLTM